MSAAQIFEPHPDWGTTGSFVCAGCEQERDAMGGMVHPAGWPESVRVGVCSLCWQRMTDDKHFRAFTEQRCGEVARRSYIHRVADTMEVAPAKLIEAMTSAQLDMAEVDRILELPLGRTAAAVDFVQKGMGVGACVKR